MIILLEITGVLLWIALLLLRAARLEPSDVSSFEVQRRAKAGEVAAKQELQFRKHLTEVGGLQKLLSALGMLAFIVVVLYVFGFAWGGVVAVLGYVLLELASRLQFARNQANSLINKYGGPVLKLTRYLKLPLKLFVRANNSKQFSLGSTAELLDLLDRDKTVLNAEQKLAVRQLLKYSTKTIKQIMTPRQKIVSLKAGDPLAPLVLDDLHKTGHACFPVVKDDLNSVVGLLYLQDVMPLNPDLKKIKQAMWPHVFYVHQDQPVDHLLAAGLHTGRHLFIVVNDKKETVGLATMTDALHQLTGRNLANMSADYENLDSIAGQTM